MSHDQKHLYIGTSRGVFIYDIYTKSFSRLSLVDASNASKINTSIADLKEDTSGRLWIATWGAGVLCIDHPLTSPVLALYLNTRTDPC